MDPKQQKFNFAAFVRTRWPSLEVQDGARPFTFTAAGDAIESVFWLGLGSELGVYPRAQTKRLLTLSKSLTSRIETGNEDRLKLVIPEIQWLELAELLEGRRVDHFPDRIEPDAPLLSYFNSAVYLSCRMNADSLGSGFREFLMFAKQAQWTEMIESPVAVDVVNDLLLHGRGPSRPSLESMIAGFFSTTRMMVMLSDFFSALQREGSLPGSRSTLARRCGRITCWCLDFSFSDAKRRFLEAAKVAEAVLHNVSALTEGRVTVNGEAFNDSMKMLADRWEHFHPKYRVMTA